MAISKVDAAAQAMIDNLPKKTGSSLPRWLAVLARTKLERHGEILKFLKGEHGVTRGFANLSAAKYREGRSGGIRPEGCGIAKPPRAVR